MGYGVVRPKGCKRTRRFGVGGGREASSKYPRLGEGLSPIQSVRPGGWPYRPIKGGRTESVKREVCIQVECRPDPNRQRQWPYCLDKVGVLRVRSVKREVCVQVECRPVPNRQRQWPYCIDKVGVQ